MPVWNCSRRFEKMIVILIVQLIQYLCCILIHCESKWWTQHSQFRVSFHTTMLILGLTHIHMSKLISGSVGISVHSWFFFYWYLTPAGKICMKNTREKEKSNFVPVVCVLARVKCNGVFLLHFCCWKCHRDQMKRSSQYILLSINSNAIKRIVSLYMQHQRTEKREKFFELTLSSCSSTSSTIVSYGIWSQSVISSQMVLIFHTTQNICLCVCVCE